MRRGIADFSKQDIKVLLDNLDEKMVPEYLIKRLKALEDDKVFLSEEDVETILDALPADPSLEELLGKLRDYVQSIRA